MAGIAGGKLAGEPRTCRGRSARHGRMVRQIPTQPAEPLDVSSLSKFVRRTVRLIYADSPRFTQRACYRPKSVRGRPADGPPLSPPFRTGRSASSRRTVRPFLLNTLALTHEQPTYAPYTQSLYHSLALLEHASSCHLQIIAHIHDMLISQASFAFV